MFTRLRKHVVSYPQTGTQEKKMNEKNTKGNSTLPPLSKSHLIANICTKHVDAVLISAAFIY